MGLELGVGLAHLTGRRLALPFEDPIADAPAGPLDKNTRGTQSRILDLFEVPVEIVHPDEWEHDSQHLGRDTVDWGTYGAKVCVAPDQSADLDDPLLAAFCNGREPVAAPSSDAEVIEILGRPLAMYSYFFFATGPQKRMLHSVIRGVRARRPYRELGARIAGELGDFQAAHIRRSDLLLGLPAYKGVTPDAIAETTAKVLDPNRPLLLCTEAEPTDEVFAPLLDRFPNVIFANELIVGDHGQAFEALPRHDDNVLGLITQEVAARSSSFIGTMGSTFTAIIQRDRIVRDPTQTFLYTADYTPSGPLFRDGSFVDTAEGPFSWNRQQIAMSPDALAWFREWPEVA